MPFFNYTARDRSGLESSDLIESDTQSAAIIELRQQGLLVLKIAKVKERKSSSGDFSWNPLDYRSIRSFDVEHGFHQLSVMLRSGMNLMDALEMNRKTARIGVRKTWQAIKERVEQGSSLTDALAQHKIFSNLTIQLVRVGEETGMLAMVLDQAADELTATRKLKKQIKGALKYPAFVLLMAIGVVVFMLTSIIPEIKKLLLIMGKPMPPITQALLDTSDWFLEYTIPITIVTFAFLVAFIICYNWPPTRLWIDRIALKIPVFGQVFQLSGTVLFTRAMGLLLRSGILIDSALEIMEKLHTNKFMARQIATARERVLQGSSLAEPLQNDSSYTPLVLQMIHVGESSGTLDAILLEMTEYHDELLTQAIDRLTGLIAPTMTIIIGGIIGFVYAAFLVAMFSAAGGSPS